MAVKHNNNTQEEDDFLASLCYGDEAPEKNEGGSQAPKPKAWLLFLYLLVSPKVGWRRIKSSNVAVDDYARTIFYPLLALVAACRFVDKIYFPDHTTGYILQRSIALFVAGFAGYFLICLLAHTFLPPGARNKIESRYGKLLIMSTLSALALSTVIAELLPWLELMLMVMPIYCAYILAKGVRYLRIPERESMATTIFLIVLCAGIPVGIYYALTLMMPPA